MAEYRVPHLKYTNYEPSLTQMYGVQTLPMTSGEKELNSVIGSITSGISHINPNAKFHRQD